MKPETVFIQAVHRHLPAWIHREKINNPYRRGMPDVYYEASGASLWVEYKWLVQASPIIHPRTLLSANQISWLRRAYDNLQKPAVIVGSPKQSMLLTDLSWEAQTLAAYWLDTRAATNWIIQRLTHNIHEVSE